MEVEDVDQSKTILMLDAFIGFQKQACEFRVR